jgi:hypothetical protein
MKILNMYQNALAKSEGPVNLIGGMTGPDQSKLSKSKGILKSLSEKN